MGYRCLFCYVDIKDDGVLIKRENVGLKHFTSPLLEQQVKVIFILRKLLEIPEGKLKSFLEDWGHNPSEWIRLCQQCEESVANARKIYGEILEMQRRFRGVQHRIVEVTKGSCHGDGGGGKERTGKYGRRAVAEDCGMAIANECRAIIQERTDQWPMSEDNPFVEGDLMAETAVIAWKRTVSIEDDEMAPVKDEVIFEDEPESILPSDHFDDFSTEDPVLMNCENVEDSEDDEWVPDPLESISPRRKSFRSKVLSRSKLKRKNQGKSGRSTFGCPVCQNFKCNADEGEQLCEHLEFCREKFGDENCHLSCPLCKNFTIDIGGKVEFVEHMSWCDAINRNLDEHDSSLLRWKMFSCNTCGEKGKTKFMKIDQFVDHLIQHIRCPFRCTHCPQRFKTDTSQYNFYHYKVNHPKFLQPVSSRCVFDGDLPSFFWWCPVSKCSEKFTTHCLRDEHMQLEHAESCQDIRSRKSVICGICSTTFFCAEELRLHNATSHVFLEQEQGRVEKSVQNQKQQKKNPNDANITTTLVQKQKITKRKVALSSSSESDESAISEEDEEKPRSNVKPSRQSPKPTSTEQQGFSRKEFQEILKLARNKKDKESKSHSQSILVCPHCNKFPLNIHQLPEIIDHMETCLNASDMGDNSYEMKQCPVCLVKKFQIEATTVEYVEHVASCNNRKRKDDDGDGNGLILIPLENRLFKCTTCAEDEKKWMQVDDFLEHYIYHLRYRFKCCSCSHRFVTNSSKDNHYHYKVAHPDKLADPIYTRCKLELELPKVRWWCPVCSEKFSDDDERNVHFHHHHPAEYSTFQANNGKYMCQWCSKTYYCADELRYHQGTKHVFDERERMGKIALKPDRDPSKPPGQKTIQNKATRSQTPKRFYGEACHSKTLSSVGPTVVTTKQIVTLSSSEFFTKLQFRQFLRKHFRQLNYKAEFTKPHNIRLLLCNICPDREVMDITAFLDHYLFHKRNIFKCTKCNHRFPSNESQDTKYHYKTVHPEHSDESASTRCVEDAVLPELIWLCIYCKEEYSNEHLRDSHVEMEHQDKLPEEKHQLCQFCSKKYSNSEELLIHIGTTHVLVEKFRKAIPLSSSNFFTKSQFKEILKKHFTQQKGVKLSKSKYNRLFLCNICSDRKAMGLAAFLDHYLFHRRNIFKCTKCSHRFPSNESQDTGYHYRTVHPEHSNKSATTRCVEDAVLPGLIWVCSHCSEEFSSENLRDSHEETEHQDQLSEEKSQLCQLCPKKYSCPEELLIHIGTTHVLVEKHRNNKRFKCSECLETFEKWSGYKNHCRKLHTIGKFADNDDEVGRRNLTQASWVICDVCGKQIKHTYLKEHLRLHKRTKKFHCEVPGCGESFTTNEYLGLHKFRKHESRDPGKNPLVCPYCPAGEKVLHNRPYLRKHIQIVHHKKFTSQCHMCGKGFIYKSQLLKHMSRTHQVGTQGQHKCPIEGCEKVFYWKGVLQDHLSKHKGEPKYKCRFCGKEFYFRIGMKRHELIHKNAESKPYQCEICAKRFPVRNYLYIHMKSHNRKRKVQ